MNTLNAGERLRVDQGLDSTNGRVRLVMQGDGNLVLYRTHDALALWASNTWGTAATHAVMQTDGNLVVYDDVGTPYWDSATYPNSGARLVLQDDGNLVVLTGDEVVLWASNTVQRIGPVVVPGFRPSTNAPRFGNGPWPARDVAVTINGSHVASLQATRMGLCGGMSFVTRDIFEAGTAQLRGERSNALPPSVFDHLFARMVDSLVSVPPPAVEWWSLTAGDDAAAYRATLASIPTILADVDAGTLSPIGVVLVHGSNPKLMFENHVELVWGYEWFGDLLTLHTYDCNRPKRDDITIDIDVSGPELTPIRTNGSNREKEPTGTVRGLFRLGTYRHSDPAPMYADRPYVTWDGRPEVVEAGASFDATLIARNGGTVTWDTTGGWLLVSADPPGNTRWGVSRIHIDIASRTVDPGQDVPLRIRATAPDAAGQYTFLWHLQRADGTPIAHQYNSGVIRVGARGGFCVELGEQHAVLVRELADVHRAITEIDWSDPHSTHGELRELERRQGELNAQIAMVEIDQAAKGCAPG